MNFIVNTNYYTNEYMTAMKFLLKKAGYKLDEWYDGDAGDLAIYFPDNDKEMENVLNVFSKCDLL